MTLDQYIDSIKDKRIAVIGIGVSNSPLVELLLRSGCQVTACDKHSLAEMGEEGRLLKSLGAEFSLCEDYLEHLDHDIIFRTPGLLPFDRHLEAARARGSLVTSEMEVFFSLCPCPIIAVTGSDGKTTTTTIISELLKAAGYTVHLGGNIGHPLLCEVPEMKESDFAVLELSSFQLHSMQCSPDVAVITNVSPNHLDKHKDYQDYIDAKANIFLHQSPRGKLVLNREDGHTAYYAAKAPGQLRYFSDKAPVKDGVMCRDGVIYRVRDGQERAIMRADEIRLPGEHNLLNYMAAFGAVEGLVDDELCRKVAMEFQGVEHRLEHVRTLRGVEYINDSIGTSPTRTIAGLHALKTKPIVIAGGYDKKIPFGGLGDELCKLAKRVYLTGDTAKDIQDAITGSAFYPDSGLEVRQGGDFRETVLAAAASAEEGDIVLLSPACAAYDHFKNFAERGKLFKQIVMELE